MTFTSEQEADDVGGAGGGELPVGLELSSVDGNIVGVALDAEVASDRGEDEGETIKGIHGAGAQGCRAAFEESDLAQTEHESFGVSTHGDGVVFKLGGEAAFELSANGFGGLAGANGNERGGDRAGNDELARRPGRGRRRAEESRW